MDPDANLKEQRQIIARMISRENRLPDDPTDAQREVYNRLQTHDGERLKDLAEALDGWITGGGFLPLKWQQPPAAGTKPLTQLEFRPQDFTIAQQLAERLGYKQYPYTSTSDLIGLYCLRENPERAPAGSPQYNAVIIRTRELGIMVVQDLEDLRMDDLWRKDRR